MFKLLLTIISKFILLLNKIKVFIVPTELQKNTMLENKIEQNLVEETFKNFKIYFKKSVLFKDISQVREYAIKTSLLNDKNKDYYYLEFGVFKGTSTNFFSKYVNKFYVFDSFEGLNNDWIGTSNNPKINFVHLDMDTYNPTKYTLEKLKPYLVKNAIIIFDELYNFVGWEHGEYKALKEVFNEDEFEYRGFNIKGAQVVIKIN